jgi:hypothetical protein
MIELREILRRADPDRLSREALGLASLCTAILALFCLPGFG